ncbi:MAG: tetratricopeptide repeat protein [Candidatus Hydrogenedentes bacterium]|nr:tetratricopeptide repeat protein [Candidatus Hydrogenedentota bacterium]
MKRIWGIVFVILLASCAASGATGESPKELLEKGVYSEDTVGDLDGAVKIYRQIIENAKADRPLVAQAYYRLGSVLLKSGRQKEAFAAFEDLSTTLPEQKELIALAQRAMAPFVGSKPTRNDPRSWFYFESRDTAQGPRLMLTFGDKTEELAASQDTVLISYLADRAWGAHAQLSIAANDMNRVLVQFPIPAGAGRPPLTRAELVLNEKIPERPAPVDPTDVAIHAVLGDWNERETSWLKQPAIDPKRAAMTLAPPEPGTVRVDLTDLVKRWLDGSAPNHGLMLKAASPVYGAAPWDTSQPAGRYTAKEVQATDVDALFSKMIYGEVGRQYHAALWGLMAKATDAPDIRAAVVTKAIGILKDTAGFGYARWLCCYVLSGLHDEASVPLLAETLRHDPDSGVRMGAADALGDFNSDAARSIVKEAAANERSERVKAAIEKSLSGEGRSDPSKREYLAADASPAAPLALSTLPAGNDEAKGKAEDFASKGWTLWNARKLSEAEEAFRAATALDPSQSNAWNGLGWSLLHQGRKVAAKEAFAKCLAVDSKHPAALNGLGWIAKDEVKTDEAISYWEKAVAAAPGATAALNGLAKTYMEKGQPEKAATYYEKWLAAEPQSPEAKAGLAEAKAASAKAPAAEKPQAEAPKDKAQPHEQSLDRAAHDAFDRGDLVGACDAVMQRVHIRKDTGHPYKDKIDLASILNWRKDKAPGSSAGLDLKDQREKLKTYLAQHESDPEYPWRLHHLLSAVAAELGDKQQAAEEFDRAIAAYPDTAYPDPSKHSKFQHLVNERAGLIWDAKGEADAVAYALEKLKTDKRYHHFFDNWWREQYAKRNGSVDGQKQYEALLVKVKEAYEARKKNFPDEKIPGT